MAEGLIAASAVALGAALGGPARLFLTQALARRTGEAFPWGTLAVNVGGACAIGAAAGYAATRGLAADSAFWLFAATGVLGSLTTVSSFALQTNALIGERDWRRAALYVAASLLLGPIACAGGYALLA